MHSFPAVTMLSMRMKSTMRLYGKTTTHSHCRAITQSHSGTIHITKLKADFTERLIDRRLSKIDPLLLLMAAS